MEVELREMRRRFGLTQTQLSDLLGVTQSTISRWEKGVEPIYHSKRLELLDLFSNRNGKLDPLIKHLLAHSNHITVFDFDYNCITSANLVLQATRIEKSDIVGRNYSQLCETDWFSTIHDTRGTRSNNVLVELRLISQLK